MKWNEMLHETTTTAQYTRRYVNSLTENFILMSFFIKHYIYIMNLIFYVSEDGWC